jgi:hypothetical protein
MAAEGVTQFESPIAGSNRTLKIGIGVIEQPQHPFVLSLYVQGEVRVQAQFLTAVIKRAYPLSDGRRKRSTIGGASSLGPDIPT